VQDRPDVLSASVLVIVWMQMQRSRIRTTHFRGRWSFSGESSRSRCRLASGDVGSLSRVRENQHGAITGAYRKARPAANGMPPWKGRTRREDWARRQRLASDRCRLRGRSPLEPGLLRPSLSTSPGGKSGGSRQSTNMLQ
jgi:hypothetical protein